MPTIHISKDRAIGSGQPCFIIAEAGVNHNGSLELAYRLVDAASEAGADAVKFQTFTPESVVSIGAPKAAYQLETTGKEESQLEMIRSLSLSVNDHLALVRYSDERKIQFLSTPFDEESLELLRRFDLPVLKVASGEITNWPFLERVGCQCKPVLLSTGMSYLSEVDEAIRVLQSSGCPEIVLLHCVSSYPAEPSESNLRAMVSLRCTFQRAVGFSDHTTGIEVPIAAVALGACVIEKHLTLDKSMPGPDHRMSLSPTELRQLIDAIRLVETALGDGHKRPMPSEEDVRRVARRSIVTRMALQNGTIIERDMLDFKRPAAGFPPSHLNSVLGRRLRTALAADAIIKPEDLD